MERCFSTVVCLLVLAVCEVTGEPEGRANSSSNGILVEQARYDHYEDIFRYWWPWFSDLATVVAIKLKIWIILVAMNVFGDGYYWSKWNGSSSQYVQPPGFGWLGRRRRAVDTASTTNMAELIFDKLDINDDTCRRRIVCELYLEGKRVSEVWRVLNDSGYDVFRAYRPKATVLSSSECSKLYNCQLHKAGDNVVELRPKAAATSESGEDDWRWPR